MKFWALVGLVCFTLGIGTIPPSHAGWLGKSICASVLVVAACSGGVRCVQSVLNSSRLKETTLELRNQITGEWPLVSDANPNRKRNFNSVSQTLASERAQVGGTLRSILREGDFYAYAAASDPQTRLSESEFVELAAAASAGGAYTLSLEPTQTPVDLEAYLQNEEEDAGSAREPDLSYFLSRDSLSYVFGAQEMGWVRIRVEVLSFWTGYQKQFSGSFFRITEMAFTDAP